MVHSSHKPADLLGGNDPPIHLGRPGGAPAVIFNPALANLQRLDHLEELPVSRSEVGRAVKYLRCAITFYIFAEQISFDLQFTYYSPPE